VEVALNIAYREFFPSADLSDVVERYWSMSAPDSKLSIPEQLVPVSPAVELFFNLGAPYVRKELAAVNDSAREVRGSHLVGFRVKPVVVAQKGPIRVFGIRCKPEGIAAILPFALGEASHAVVPLDELWGSSTRELEEALRESTSDMGMITVVESYLRQVIKRRKERPLETHLFSTIRNSGGTISIGQLAAESGSGYKRIERSFSRVLGVPPKFYARVVRYQRAAESLLREPEGESWIDAGFSDQAHFIREFSGFTGFSPVRFLSGAQPISRWLLE
jgi:AraC-like DNA-binding protein